MAESEGDLQENHCQGENWNPRIIATWRGWFDEHGVIIDFSVPTFTQGEPRGINWSRKSGITLRKSFFQRFFFFLSIWIIHFCSICAAYGYNSRRKTFRNTETGKRLVKGLEFSGFSNYFWLWRSSTSETETEACTQYRTKIESRVRSLNPEVTG